jgi:hypothetical protein
VRLLTHYPCTTMASAKDEAVHLEAGAPALDTNHLEHVKHDEHGYADSYTQKQNHSILDGSEAARQIEKRYRRRLDMIILPTVSLLYFFEYLDRGNVAVRDMRASTMARI